MRERQHKPQEQYGGEARMLDQCQQNEVLQRHGEGQGLRRIAREMDISRNTVRQMVRRGAVRAYERRQRPERLIDPYAAWIARRFFEVEGNAALLYQELKTRGYPGGYTAVREYVRPLRAELARQVACVRFETPPGQQAQVDWGSKTVEIGGKIVRVHIFVMTLGFSRTQYAEFTLDEKLETLVGCHEHAFAWFGGVTEDILYDNPKTIVLERNGDRARINPKFEDFSRYYGYTARLCRPYRAQTKGKVESGVKYIKRSFLPGKSFASLDEANACLWQWIRAVADERIHGTTFEKPSTRFQDEHLTPLGNRPAYALRQPILRKVANDSMVSLDASRYSVPWRYVGEVLEVRRRGERVEICRDGTCVASHLAAGSKHQNVERRITRASTGVTDILYSLTRPSGLHP